MGFSTGDLIRYLQIPQIEKYIGTIVRRYIKDNLKLIIMQDSSCAYTKYTVGLAWKNENEYFADFSDETYISHVIFYSDKKNEE